MKLTVDLSLYPLHDDYIPTVQAFIIAAEETAGVVVMPNAMSTQICGDYDTVFALVSEQLKTSWERFGKQVLVCKFIPGELDLRN